MSNTKMHDNEAEIDALLVKQLLKEQFPQWAKLSIKPVSSAGTDNAIYRLGTDMCVRLPRTSEAAKHIEYIEKEQQWLSQAALTLPLAIPAPLGKGNPTGSYPWNWYLYRWLEGESAANEKIVNLPRAANDLAQFIITLQQSDATGGPLSRRGVPLITQDKETREAIEALHDIVNTEAAIAAWEECLQAPEWDKPPVWTHGDLLPSNLLVQHGQLSAVIDFDLLGIGDPACDLIPAWSVFSANTRDIFRNKMAVDDATWMRGRGWALSIAFIIIPYYQSSNLELTAIAKRMLKELLADA